MINYTGVAINPYVNLNRTQSATDGETTLLDKVDTHCKYINLMNKSGTTFIAKVF